MLIFDKNEIGTRLRRYRKAAGLTQAELSEAAEIADRTYADIERGSTNMRIDTLIKICKVLKITPNDILLKKAVYESFSEEAFMTRLSECTPEKKEEALRVLNALID